MGKIAIILGIMLLATPASAQNMLTPEKIDAEIIKVVTNYANAISCEPEVPTGKKVIALSAYTSFDNWLDAKYAVLWHGDIGCSGGSASDGTYIAIVTVDRGGDFFVDPLQSSPVVIFDSAVRYVDKIIGNTNTSLTLEGLAYGKEDPNCCPSVKTRFTLQLDAEGNWKNISKK